MNKVLALNGFHYHLISPLGSPGFVAQAYLAEAVDFPALDTHVVVKLPSSLAQSSSVAVEQLMEEARVVRKLNCAEVRGWADFPDAGSRAVEAARTVAQRSIVAGIDAGETLDGEWCVIQERAPGPVALEPVSDRQAELRTIDLARRVAEAVSFVHSQGIALKDFSPQSKIDRIRVAWDGDQLRNFKIIDWNISGDPAHSLEISNDLVFLGGVIFAFFTGHFLPLERHDQRYDFPMLEISAFVGSTWTQLSEATRLLLKRLVNPLSTERLQSASVIEDELQWLEHLLQRPDLSPKQWVEMVHRDRDDPYHVLAIVATAQGNELPTRVQGDLAYAERTARQRLEAEQQRVIRDIEADLRDGVFSQALKRLREAKKKLAPSGEAARQANYRLQQALLGDALRQEGINARKDEGYRRTASAVDALVERHWRDAERALQSVFSLDSYPPVQALRAVIEWRSRQDDVREEIQTESIPSEDVNLSFETAKERERVRLENLRRIERRLKDWLAYAPFEAELQSQALALGLEIDQREEFLGDWKTALSKLEAGEDAAAVEIGQRWLRFDSQDVRAKALVEEAELTRRLRAQASDLEALLDQGEYTQVQARLAKLEEEHADGPVWTRVRERIGLPELQSRAEEGSVQREQASTALAQVERDLEELASRAEQLPPPDGDMAPPSAEIEIVQKIASQQEILSTWRMRHAKRSPILSDDQLEVFDVLDGRIATIKADLVARHMSVVESALVHFGALNDQDRRSIGGLLGYLSQLSPDDRYLARLRSRLDRLELLLDRTDAALESDDIERITRAFEQVAGSQDVAGVTRHQVQEWLDGWRIFQRNPRTRNLLSKNKTVDPWWPGLGRLREVLLDEMFGQTIRRADAACEAGEYLEAKDAYDLAKSYGEFDVLRQDRLKAVTKEMKEYQWALEIIRSAEADESDKWRHAWQYPDLRGDVIERWEARIWETLPPNPAAADLERARRLFWEAHRVTKEGRWEDIDDLCRRAAELLRRREKWSVSTSWLDQADEDQNALQALQGEDVPQPLRGLALTWEIEWQQAAENHWKTAHKEAHKAFKGERAQSVLRWAAEADRIAFKAHLSPSSAQAKELKSLQTRGSALLNRDNEIQKGLQELEGEQKEVSESHIRRIERACCDAQLYEFESQPHVEALAERLRQIHIKQAALRVPEGAATCAQRIEALQSAVNIKPDRDIESLPKHLSWSGVLYQWDERLRIWDAKVVDAFWDARAELVGKAQSTTSRAFTRLREDHGPIPLKQIRDLLWQLAWLAECQGDEDAAVQLENSLDVLLQAIAEERDEAIETTDSPVTYRRATKWLRTLRDAVEIFTTFPSNVVLPGVGSQWEPQALKRLYELDTDWQPLLETWQKLGHFPDFDTLQGALDQIGERVEWLETIRNSVGSDIPALSGWQKSLGDALPVIRALERVEQSIIQNDLRQAQQRVTKLPEPYNEAQDWLQPVAWMLGDRRVWLIEQVKDAWERVEDAIKEHVEDLLNQREVDVQRAKERYQGEVLGAAIQAGAQELASQAIWKVARNAADKDADPKAVWEFVRPSSDDLPDLSDRVDQEIRRLKAAETRRQMFIRLIQIGSLCLVTAYVLLMCFVFKKDAEFPDCLVPVPYTPTPIATMTAIPTATPTATPTSTPTSTPTRTPTPTQTPLPVVTCPRTQFDFQVGNFNLGGPRTCLQPTVEGTHGEIRCWVTAEDEVVLGLRSDFVLTNTGGCEFVHPHLFDMSNPLTPLTVTLPSFVPLYDPAAPEDSLMSLIYEWPPLEPGSYTPTLALGVENVANKAGALTVLGSKSFTLTLDIVPLVDRDGDRFVDSKDDCCVGTYGKLRGCPDEDGDGFVDTPTRCGDLTEDCCIGTYGPVTGCPDRDTDGFVDVENACGMEVDRCPDEWALLPGGCCERREIDYDCNCEFDPRLGENVCETCTRTETRCE